MRKEAPFFLLLAGLICSLSACTSGISTDYKQQLETVLNQSSRADSLRLLLHKTPHDEQEAMAYLIAWMPQGDRDTMNLDLLKENVAYACRVRSEFSWTKALPDSIFLNEVLPYAVVDETRDPWRQDFYNRFAPRIAKCADIRAAIDTINRIIPEVVGVEYNTLREKTNQSPAESIRQGMASCTGLSILLVDAFRSVGIPARFAGTAAWHDNRGNHSWTEVWINEHGSPQNIINLLHSTRLGLWPMPENQYRETTHTEFMPYHSDLRETGFQWRGTKMHVVFMVSMYRNVIEIYTPNRFKPLQNKEPIRT